MDDSQDSENSENYEEPEKEVFKYYTEESRIQPNNETTLKKIRELQAKERLEQQKLAKHQQAQKAMKDLQKAQEQEEKERMRNERKRRELEELKTKEEKEFLKEIKGNFGILISNIKSNETPLELVMTGTDFKSVETRLIFKAIERNTSIRVNIYF